MGDNSLPRTSSTSPLAGGARSGSSASASRQASYLSSQPSTSESSLRFQPLLPTGEHSPNTRPQLGEGSSPLRPGARRGSVSPPPIPEPEPTPRTLAQKAAEERLKRAEERREKRRAPPLEMLTKMLEDRRMWNLSPTQLRNFLSEQGVPRHSLLSANWVCRRVFFEHPAYLVLHARFVRDPGY